MNFYGTGSNVREIGFAQMTSTACSQLARACLTAQNDMRMRSLSAKSC